VPPVFDLITCPYVSQQTREDLGDIFGLGPGETEQLRCSNNQWFTVSGNKFDLNKELDAKRSREVY